MKKNIFKKNVTKPKLTKKQSAKNNEKHYIGQTFEILEKNTEIIVNNLLIQFNDKKVIDNCSFIIPKRKIISLIGKSGSGKSTILRSFNRMNDLIPQYRTKGEIFIDGKNILKNSHNVSALRTKVGMVFQRPTPFDMSIYENVAYGPKIIGIKKKAMLKEIVDEALINAGIYEEVKDILDENACNLSGGQQQRICIARTIALNPEIILFDEPTSSLDPISTDIIENLILKLKKKYTIIFVTHSLKQAARVSDYTMLIEKGKIVEYSKTSKLFIRPKSKITKKYISYSEL